MIKYRNTKSISSSDLVLVKDLVSFVMDKFFTKKRQNNLQIEIRFTKTLYKRKNQYANCIWEDTHYRPTEFTIEVDSQQPIGLLLNSVAHELVHVKQWAKGEFYQLMRKPKIYVYKRSRIDTKVTNYWDLPWEIEAHGWAIGLVVQWYASRKLTDEKLLDCR